MPEAARTVTAWNSIRGDRDDIVAREFFYKVAPYRNRLTLLMLIADA